MAKGPFFLFLSGNRGFSIFQSFFFYTMAQSELDVFDVNILRILQKDASLTNKEIASQLNKSVATVHERVRRLKEQGYIKRVVAILDRKRSTKA